ncbi:MAG: hypothetical protein RBU30_04055 [Polyangia bacterium]|nr:hypothetical protein [Polyangia bacterium]
MKHAMLLLLLCTLALASPREALGQDSRILSYMDKDPQVKTYADLGIRGNSFRLRWKHDIPQRLHRDCNTSYGWAGCKAGWDAFAGRPMPGVADFVAASVAVAKWHDAGKVWVYKLQYMPSFTGRNALDGLVLFNVPNAAALALETIKTPKRLRELSSGDHSNAYRVLWYLGAKNYADRMIKGMSTRRGRPLHVSFGLHVLHNWKLTRPQIEMVEKLCVNEIFQGTDGDAKHAVPACARFLGFVQTTNGDAREYLGNLTGDRSDGRHGVRALGLIGHKGSRRLLTKKFQEGYRKSTITLRKGRRRVNKVMDVWNPSQEVVPAAVALIAMGDPKAKAAVSNWTTFDAGDKKLLDDTGWEELSFELPFAHPKAYAAIRGPFLKTYKQLLRAAESEQGLRRYSLAATIGLAQAGEAAVLKPLLEALRSTDQREVLKVLKGIGGDIERMYDNQQTGCPGIRVGKGGFTVAQAKQVASEIRRRFKFWNDEELKRVAIQAALDIEARIKAQEP